MPKELHKVIDFGYSCLYRIVEAYKMADIHISYHCRHR